MFLCYCSRRALCQCIVPYLTRNLKWKSPYVALPYFGEKPEKSEKALFRSLMMIHTSLAQQLQVSHNKLETKCKKSARFSFHFRNAIKFSYSIFKG